jgi:hypothetical protein
VRRIALALVGLLSGCAAGFSGSAHSAADGATPPVLQGAVPFAILLVVGLVIGRNFKND